jgi:hypothetical protein
MPPKAERETIFEETSAKNYEIYPYQQSPYSNWTFNSSYIYGRQYLNNMHYYPYNSNPYYTNYPYYTNSWYNNFYHSPYAYYDYYYYGSPWYGSPWNYTYFDYYNYGRWGNRHYAWYGGGYSSGGTSEYTSNRSRQSDKIKKEKKTRDSYYKRSNDNYMPTTTGVTAQANNQSVYNPNNDGNINNDNPKQTVELENTNTGKNNLHDNIQLESGDGYSMNRDNELDTESKNIRKANVIQKYHFQANTSTYQGYTNFENANTKPKSSEAKVTERTSRRSNKDSETGVKSWLRNTFSTEKSATKASSTSSSSRSTKSYKSSSNTSSGSSWNRSTSNSSRSSSSWNRSTSSNSTRSSSTNSSSSKSSSRSSKSSSGSKSKTRK